jgi:hypothetical protein
MSDDRKEIEYYPEICEKLEKYLSTCLGPGCPVAFSSNGLLPKLVSEIHEKLGVPRLRTYYPDLKVDILCGVKIGNEKISLCLIEVKRGSSLRLLNFSQLVGYMQVAKHIKIGLLLLVNEGSVGTSPLSSDFSSIIDTGNLPADWETMLRNTRESFSFRVGICTYLVNNGIDWVSSENCHGISGWEMLKESLTTDSEPND